MGKKTQVEEHRQAGLSVFFLFVFFLRKIVMKTGQGPAE